MSARKTCGATGCRKTFIPKSRQKFCSVKCQRSTAYKRNKKETIYAYSQNERDKAIHSLE